MGQPVGLGLGLGPARCIQIVPLAVLIVCQLAEYQPHAPCAGRKVADDHQDTRRLGHYSSGKLQRIAFVMMLVLGSLNMLKQRR